MSTKDSVLEMLEKNRGHFVSSKDMISENDVSRNAIWKAVNELKKAGYDIDAVTNKGYRLSADSDVISIPSISSYMNDKEIADKIIIYDEVTSTNQAAKLSLIMEDYDKSIIIARRQTAGVGHSSSHYDSPEGGIYISIVIKPEQLYHGKKLKAESIGKTVAHTIEKLTYKKTELDRSTNRIYINKKKVCGILTEYMADLETGNISCYIIGIGIKMKGIRKNLMIAKVIEEIYRL